MSCAYPCSFWTFVAVHSLRCGLAVSASHVAFLLILLCMWTVCPNRLLSLEGLRMPGASGITHCLGQAVFECVCCWGSFWYSFVYSSLTGYLFQAGHSFGCPENSYERQGPLLSSSSNTGGERETAREKQTTTGALSDSGEQEQLRPYPPQELPLQELSLSLYYSRITPGDWTMLSTAFLFQSP